MRFRSFGTIGGAIGIAALAAASSDGDLTTCAASLSTVLVTVQSVITVHDAPTSTVYVNMSELPLTTLTTIKTTTSTAQAHVIITVPNAATPVTTPVYEATVTETVYATISNVQVVPAKSGPLVTSSKTTASSPFGYIVNNGTTYWVNIQTPTSAAAYVIETSIVTVVPIHSTPTTSEDETSTLISQTTVFLTRPFTITETEALTISTSSWGIYPTASVGTGALGFSMAPGGWNVSGSTSTTAGIIVSTSGSHSSSASEISVSYSSVGIYNPSNGIIPSLTSLSAAVGFTSQSSSPSSLTIDVPYVNKSITFARSALGALTSLTSTSCTENTTTLSRSISATYTSSALGVLTTLFSTSYTENVTASIAFSSSAVGISSALGGLTFLSSTSRIANFTSTTSPLVSALVTSSALGAFTSITSNLYSENATTTTTPVPKSSVNPSKSVSVNSISSSRASTSYNSGGSTTLPSSNSVSVPVNSITSVLSSTSSALGFLTSSSSGLPATGSVSAASSTASPFSSSPASSISSTLISTTKSVPVSTGLLSFTPSSGSPSLPTTFLTSVTPSSIYSQLSSSKPITTTSSSASTSASVSATPSMCGEVGDFTLNFDDIPPLSVSNQSESTIQPAPVFNPYHQFDFSDGFVVVPPPTDPYLPSSPKQLLEFIPNFNSNGTNPSVGPNTLDFGYSGDVGNADHGVIGCFSFNAYGASFGCDSTGPDCDFSFTGFRYNSSSGQTLPVTQQSIVVPACPALKSCELEPVVLLPAFSNLDSLRINVTVAGQPKIWWMDDLALGWYNNTCMAGLCRQNAHIP